MRVLLQKVSSAEVLMETTMMGSIDEGYVLLLGVMKGDTDERCRWLAEKVVGLRLFPGEGGKINDKTVLEIGGGILVVSQFTLAGDVAKGNRPDYTAAAERTEAKRLYDLFVRYLNDLGVRRLQTGRFGAMMSVRLTNEGPVTLILDR